VNQSAAPDGRPPIAIGHVSLRVSEVAKAAEFYKTLGMREVMNRPGMAIFELRGGTHLLLFRARGKPRAGPVRSFDFIVDDVDAFRTRLETSGIAVGAIEQDPRSGHRSFEVADPDGHVLGIYSNHALDREV
jgi:catechol 2,3-dioxygenase-like lactoylglutathione lyase family enzyme